MDQHVDIAIGLGSNLGDRLRIIREAALILASDFLEDATSSKVYESEPWGDVKDQPHYLNAVIRGRCEWKPPAIVNYLKVLERQLGREPGPKYTARLIDLDLIAFGEMTWEGDGISVPHKCSHQRDFVLLPMMDVWPNWIDPRTAKPIETLWTEFLKTERSTARFFAPRLLDKVSP